MLRRILIELRNHAPFTLAGAMSGIVLMILFKSIQYDTAYRLFYIFHPMHVFFSAIVTTAIFKIYTDRSGSVSLIKLVIVGYLGSVGIGTISDSLIPYLGEMLLNLPHGEAHIGFIEEWWIVNPLALAGIAIGYFKPNTKLPHTGHVLLSTWASLFHMVMALGVSVLWYDYLVLFLFLFISVWLPCCFSDIVFPLLFVKGARSSDSHGGCGCGCH